MEHFWSFFSFPLNIMLAILWMVGWGWLYKSRKESAILRFMLSSMATVIALALLAVGGLWVGLSGNRTFVQSLPFVLILLYLQTVIYLITLRGWKTPSKGIRWRFTLIHVGLLLAIGAGFWGCPDTKECRTILERGQSTRQAYEIGGHLTGLGYEIQLNDYVAAYSESGQPVHYEAVISVDSKPEVKVTVNHPYNVRFGEDIYLASVSEQSCVLQIVREPWRYIALFGIIMLLAGAFMLFIGGPKRCG